MSHNAYITGWTMEESTGLADSLFYKVSAPILEPTQPPI